VKKYIKKTILLLITLIFLYFVFSNLDIKELIRIMKGFKLPFFFLLMMSVTISLSFRGLCFKLLMSKTAKLPLKEMAPLCMTTAALNVVLPARAGDFFRAFFVGQKYGINKVKVLGTVMLERIFDTLVIFTFLAGGIFFYHRNPLAMKLCSFAGIVIILGIIFVITAYKYNKTDEICGFIIKKTENFSFSEYIKNFVSFINRTCNSFFNGFEVIESPIQILKVIMAASFIWFFECVNFYIVLTGFGCHLHWSVTLFLIGFIALACMIPSASIFIGPYQMAVIAAFAIYGTDKELALSVAFVDQAGILIATSIVATVFLLRNNISFKELKEDIKQTEESN
jgi:hypothetical protein